MHINSQNFKNFFFPSWAPVGSIDRIILANQTEIFELKKMVSKVRSKSRFLVSGKVLLQQT
jgi:hypothetical protein